MKDKIAYKKELKRIAPQVVFTVSREVDESFRWDGDGPDPKRRGYLPYDVTVSAATIADGEIVREEECLGGSYYKPNEPLGDVHGYLPQMLEEAAEKLLGNPSIPMLVVDQIKAAINHMRQVMADEYEKQRSAK